MDQASLSRTLTATFDDLPEQLRQAARWVLDHPADVALLTTREQARRAGLTPATLTRLAQRLGLAGYDELRRLYAVPLRRRPEGFRGRAEELIARHGEEGGAALAQDVFAALGDHIAALATPASVASLERAADLLCGARRVICFGLRSAFPAAFMLDYVRALIGEASVLADGAGGRGIDALRDAGPGDVFFCASVNPYTRATVDAADYARAKGAKIVAITDSMLSPLARLADAAVIVRTETPSFFHTMTPAFAAVECLAALMAARKGQTALDALAASEAQLAAFGTYVLPRPARTRKLSPP